MAQQVITTNKGREKYAEALAGEIDFDPAEQMGFGDGGYSDGEVVDPDPSWTTVPGELLTKNLEGQEAVDFTTQMQSVLEQSDLVGEDISAAGIYDEGGDLIAVATFSPIPKGEEDKIEFDWNTGF